jgi:hypothetical protein
LAELQGGTAEQNCRAELQGRTAGQSCRAELQGRTAGQNCRAEQHGRTAGQNCRAECRHFHLKLCNVNGCKRMLLMSSLALIVLIVFLILRRLEQ